MFVLKVSSICWNPEFPDLFAVGYGSYDFVKQGSGLICCFSLKNTSYPEYVMETESGVMSLGTVPVVVSSFLLVHNFALTRPAVIQTLPVLFS